MPPRVTPSTVQSTLAHLGIRTRGARATGPLASGLRGTDRSGCGGGDGEGTTMTMIYIRDATRVRECGRVYIQHSGLPVEDGRGASNPLSTANYQPSRARGFASFETGRAGRVDDNEDVRCRGGCRVSAGCHGGAKLARARRRPASGVPLIRLLLSKWLVAQPTADRVDFLRAAHVEAKTRYEGTHGAAGKSLVRGLNDNMHSARCKLGLRLLVDILRHSSTILVGRLPDRWRASANSAGAQK